MKTFSTTSLLRQSLFIALLFCSSLSIYSQETPVETPATEDEAIYNSIETPPQFPGGMKAFYRYIADNYKIPKTPKPLNGSIFLTFVVEKDGSLTDIKIMRDLGYNTGEEAVRLLKESPFWTPGVQNGRTVRARFSLPIKIATK